MKLISWLALLFSIWLESLLSRTIGAFFYIAIIISSWYGGFRPGFVTVVLSTLAINYFLIAPQYQLWINTTGDVLRLCLFFVVALTMNLLTASFRYSTQKIQQLSQQLAQTNAEKLQIALSASQMGMWDWNLVTGEVTWTSEHEQLFGLPPGTFDGRNETFDACLHPEDRPEINQILQQALARHSSYQHEFRVIWPDGSIHWVEGRGQGFYNPAGEPVRMTGTVISIDERKQAQNLLQQQFEQERLVMEITQRIRRSLDLQDIDSIASLIGRSHYEIFPEVPEHWRQIHQRCLAGAIEKCDEELFIRADGTQQWVHWEIHPWHTAGNAIGGIIIFCEDITPQKQAKITLEQLNPELEQRIQERTATLTEVNNRLGVALIEQQQARQLLEEQAQLLDLAHDTIMTRDLTGKITFWNQGAEFMYGWKKAEALGQISHILLQTEFLQPLVEIEIQLLENGYWQGELIHVKRDNQPITVASRWVVQKDKSGKPIKVLEINNDITAQKQAQAALRQSEEKFRQLAENIQAVFWISDIKHKQVIYVSPAYEMIWQQSCQSLYQKASNWLDAVLPDDRPGVEIAMQEMLTTEKYDLEYRIIRPDTSIRWIRDCLRHCAPRNRAFPIKNEADEMVRLAGIAEDITERHKIEQIKNEFIGIVSHEIRTPLTAIRAALGLLNSGIYDKKPEKFKRMIEIASIDSDRLVRLVNDILDLERLESGRAVLHKTTCNAADLIQQAVEGVQSIANQQHITLNIHPTNAQVWADADAIIQTFTNLLSNAIKFSPADSTITLSVQQQPDFVQFQISDQGRGIPADKLEAIFGRFQQVDASDSRDKLVLIVDDEERIRELVQACLEDLGGWNTLTAASGKEALEIAQTEKIDAILLDVSMPDMDGFAVYDKLQYNPVTKEIQVILLTAKVLQSDRDRFAKMGIAGVISKPFEPITISEEVTEILGWERE